MRKFVRRFLAAILILMIAVAGGTFVPLPLISPAKSVGISDKRRILVLSNPIHTDIAIPLAEDTRTAYSFLERAGIPVGDPAAQWLVIGWGGRAFYLETPTWADLKPMPVFRALTLDSSVLHVDVTGGIDQAHPAVTAFDLAAPQFQNLSDFIQASFVRETGEVAAIPGAAYGAHDRFFDAHGWFNALFGCNIWTSQALRAAGLRTGIWNPIPQTLSVSLKLFN